MTRSSALSLILVALVALSVLGGLVLGPTPLSPGAALQGLLTGMGEAGLIVREVRLPRALAAALVGASLGLAGAALQGLLRNPLADPGVLGVSPSASLGAVTALYFGLAASPAGMALAAIAGAGMATALLYVLGARGLSVTGLILVGVGLSSFAGALISLVMNLAPNPFSLSDMVNWLLGSVANRSFSDLAVTAPFMAVGLALILAAGPGLSALSLGEEGAHGVGANLKRTRTLVILGASLCAGAATALAGAIGFIGVVAPHIVRPLVRHNPAAVLLPAAAMGAILASAADLLVRLVPFDQELKLGVAAALFGAPAFIAIAVTMRGRTP